MNKHGQLGFFGAGVCFVVVIISVFIGSFFLAGINVILFFINLYLSNNIIKNFDKK